MAFLPKGAFFSVHNDTESHVVGSLHVAAQKLTQGWVGC